MPNEIHKNFPKLLTATEQGDFKAVSDLVATLPVEELFQSARFYEFGLNSSIAPQLNFNAISHRQDLATGIQHIHMELYNQLNTVEYYNGNISQGDYNKGLQNLMNFYVACLLAIHEQNDVFDQWVDQTDCDINTLNSQLFKMLVGMDKNDMVKHLIQNHEPEIKNSSIEAFRSAIQNNNFELVDLLAVHPDVDLHFCRATAPTHLPAGLQSSFLYSAVRMQKSDKMLRYLIDVHNLDYTVDDHDVVKWSCYDHNIPALLYFIEDKKVNLRPYTNDLLSRTLIYGSPKVYDILTQKAGLTASNSFLTEVLEDAISQARVGPELSHITAHLNPVPKKISQESQDAFLLAFNPPNEGSCKTLEGLLTLAEKGCDVSFLDEVSPQAYQEICTIVKQKHDQQKADQKQALENIKNTFNRNKQQIKTQKVHLKRRTPKPQ